MATRAEPQPATELGGCRDRFWYLRFWDGMNGSGWFRLLAKNRFAVSPRRLAMALAITAVCPMHLALWVLQHLIYGRRIAATEIAQHPIFIIGHWRSGTTLLHELLVLDRRHTYPDTYACFAPNHFLASSWFLPRLVGIFLPSRRPMDNMVAGWARPQEDEFALCNLGVPSPYLMLAFPNRPPLDQEYLDLKGLPAAALARWQEAFVWFLKCLTLRDPKRIVLKSPPHTCRIKVLTELFPNARFVHITRDPYVLFPSTVNLWKRLSSDQGLQPPNHEGLEEYVFGTLTHMYETFERDRPLIGPGRFCEIRYEDLVRDPIEQLRTVYDRLELGEFDQMLPALREHLAGQADYKVNRYEVSPETRDQIGRRWKTYIERYGYSPESADV